MSDLRSIDYEANNRNQKAAKQIPAETCMNCRLEKSNFSSELHNSIRELLFAAENGQVESAVLIYTTKKKVKIESHGDAIICVKLADLWIDKERQKLRSKLSEANIISAI